MKKNIFLFIMIAIIVVPLAVVYAGELASENMDLAGSPLGTSEDECEGYERSLKFEGSDLTDPKTKSNDGNTITISNFGTKPDGSGEILSFNWTATSGIDKVYVKAGNDGSTSSTYDQATSGSESTINNKAVSHITFCWNDPPPTSTPTPDTPTPTATPDTPTPTPTTTDEPKTDITPTPTSTGDKGWDPTPDPPSGGDDLQFISIFDKIIEWLRQLGFPFGQYKN